MGVEDIFEGTVNITEEGLAKLDKIAEKQEAKLKKIQAKNRKAQKSRGGIFSDDTGDLPKAFEKQQEKELTQRVQKLVKEGKLAGTSGAPIQKESSFQKAVDSAIENSQSKLGKLSQSSLGTKELGSIINFGKNPIGMVTGLMGKIPILGAILSAQQIVQFIILELMKPGGPLDVRFRQVVKTMQDKFRDLAIQQAIASGFQQLIITTRAGTTNPRNSFNAFALKERDPELLEDLFSLRTPKIN